MRLELLFMLLFVTPSRPAGASELVPDLYRGESIVTGRDIASERERGIRESYVQVLVKVSADAGLTADPRVSQVLERADAAVTALDFEDRLAKKKLMDEQGTRERSYYLRVDFDPAQIDAALGSLGRRPREALRPTVLVLLAVRDLAGQYVLADAGDRGYGQRESLFVAARRAGLPVILPEVAPGGRAVPDYAAVVAAEPPDIEASRRAYAADAVLAGTMTITSEGTWNTFWRLSGHDADSWSVGPSSFDRALADGVAGALRRLYP